jgi:hypothetical protein
MFGKVGEGIHSYRIANIAIVDVIFTIIASYFIHLMFPAYKFVTIIFLLFLLGIFLHWLFCVNTTINKFLF